ncbi:unnamed protein product [Scytosiphon promiscuus]
MEHLSGLSMEMLRVSSTNKMGDALAHSHSATNMSKSISGASLSSSQATHRTQCSSGLSSVSARFANLSSTTNSPTTNPASACAGAGTDSDPAAAAAGDAPRATAPVAGGGKTVLGGVSPSCYGKLRRRARFSGWKEPVYAELRSTALLTFADKPKSGGTTATATTPASGGSGGTSGVGSSSSIGSTVSVGGHGGGGGSGSFASLAAKIMHPRHSAQPAVEWSWSADLCGAERVVELPGSSKKGLFAFAVEFPAREKKKALALAAPSAAQRQRWMAALDRARRCVQPEDFEPLSVIGEGHFGKVLLVRWNNGAASSSSSSSSSASGGGRHTRPLPSSSRPSSSSGTATIEEGSEESKDSYAIGADVAAAVSNSRSTDAGDAMTRSGRHGADRYLAVKEVALHKGTSLPGVLNERQILGVLREHPFVVTLRCAWRRGNFLYYGLDFLPGADLFELFRRNSIKMDLQAARVYGGQVALALEHLHDHGICYRDLKPENILVDAKGHLCLADMGLSKILGTGEDAVRTTTVCGTRAYLAPEMVLRKPYGMSVDFWQFGCFIYELYAGHSPFWKPRSGPPGRSHDQTVALILAGEIHYPRSIGPIAKSMIRDLLSPEVDSRLGCRPPSSPRVPAGTASERASPRSLPSPPASSSSSSPRVPPQATPSKTAVSTEDAENALASTAGGPGGWRSVKDHAFFKDMDWEALLRGEIAAPIKPSGVGRGMVGNFAREYTRQRASWGGDQQELRDVADKEGLFKRELMGFDFVRD